MTTLYVRQCPGCRNVFATGRRDRISCSTRCRVRLHRSAAHKRLRKIYEKQNGDEAYLGEVAALGVLCPDIARKLNGKHNDDDVPPWRAPLQTAFLRRLYPTAKTRNESFAAFEQRYRARPARQD